MKRIVISTLALTVMGAVHAQSDTDPNFILKRENGLEWADLFSDKAAASVSAAGMLGVSGDSIATVENVRDLVVSLKGLSTGDRGATFGLAFTPARSTLTPMDLHTYAQGIGWRILGSTTVSYAQGGTSIEGTSFDRRAVAIEANEPLAKPEFRKIPQCAIHS